MKSESKMRWLLIGALVLLSAGLIVCSAVAVRCRVGSDTLNVFALTYKVHSGEVVRGANGGLEYADWAAPEEPAKAQVQDNGSSDGSARVAAGPATTSGKPHVKKPQATKVTGKTQVAKPSARKPGSKVSVTKTTDVKKPDAKKPGASSSGTKKPATKKPACPT